MEYLAGEDLADTLACEQRLPWYRVRGIGLQLCQALAAAHEKGIIHRDLKPENCLRITRAGNPDFIKVLDFGIAKILSEVGEGGKGLTRTGSIFGTPEYMSPEQAAGEKVDHRADIYSLGVILYELLTGGAPFGAESYMGVLAKHMFEAPIAPRAQAPEAEIPLEAEAIILKAMQKDRELRFQDMHEFAAAIESVGTGAPPVAVIDEELPRPTVETVMNFAEAAVTELHRQVPLPGAEQPTEEPLELEVVDERRKLMFFVAAAALVAGTLLLSVWFLGGDPPEQPPPMIEQIVVAAPDVPSEKPVLEPDPVAFTIEFATNVDAEIRDADDSEPLGQTNGESVTFSEREQPYRLVLVAEGHEELEIEVLADADKKLEYTLAKKRSRKRRTKKKSKKTSSKKGSGLRLKNPFPN